MDRMRVRQRTSIPLHSGTSVHTHLTFHLLNRFHPRQSPYEQHWELYPHLPSTITSQIQKWPFLWNRTIIHTTFGFSIPYQQMLYVPCSNTASRITCNFW